jgi:hypothetical protein
VTGGKNGVHVAAAYTNTSTGDFAIVATDGSAAIMGSATSLSRRYGRTAKQFTSKAPSFSILRRLNPHQS